VKQLWAPWRMAYINDDAKDAGCIFCTLYRQDDQRAALVLAQTSHSVVMMNKYPYNNGHLLLAPKRHENNPDKLPSEEFIDLNEALRRSIEIIRSAFHPGGISRVSWRSAWGKLWGPVRRPCGLLLPSPGEGRANGWSWRRWRRIGQLPVVSPAACVFPRRRNGCWRCAARILFGMNCR